MNYLNRLLNFYWLRPEVALWRTFDCMLMEKHKVISPSLDIGSGDGILSYIMAGGDVGPEFDAYRNIDGTDDFVNGKDIYDAVSRAGLQSISFANSLRHHYTVGIDHKKSLLRKASMLPGFYEQLIQHDLNEPLPFQPEMFQSIFTNILYWLDNVNAVLSEANRVLRRGGRLYTFVPNDNFKQLAWICYSDKKTDDYKYLNYISRGYNSLIKHCYPEAKWIDIFEKNSFSVIEHTRYLSKPVIEVWNIGTRPISHLLIDMSRKLSDGDRIEIKNEWIEFFEKLFMPLVKFDYEADKEIEPAFHFFVLQKD
jgi:SAM-dependent methyltransferase